MRGSVGGALVAVAALVVGLALAPAAQATAPVPPASAVLLPGGGLAAATDHIYVPDHMLVAGQTLKPGQRLTSEDGRDVLVMQGDGNLVLYGKGVARWSTRTEGNPGARLVFQWDHNLVLRSKTNKVLWTSATHLAPQGTGAYLAHGELALIGGSDGHVWSTRSGYDRLRSGGTLKAGQQLTANPFPLDTGHRLVMQGDGNLVYYGDGGTATWNTRTQGHPGARAVMQGDGNLVVYSRTGKALWASGTRGTGLTLAVNPYTRGFYCEDPEKVIYAMGVLVLDRRDRTVARYPGPRTYYPPTCP